MKNINKNIVALGFVSFFTDMATAMITPLMPILVVIILHNDVQTLSQIVAIATFISYAFRIFFGYLGDKYSLSKLFVVIGYSLSALVKPLYSFANAWQFVAGLQIAERFGKAIRSASKDSIIANYSEKHETGKSFGFHKMMDIGGELTGAIIIFLILYYLGDAEATIRKIFLYTLFPGVIAVILVVFFVDDAPLQNKQQKFQWDSGDNQLMPLLSAYVLFLFFIFNPSFYVVKAADAGMQIALVPVLFIVLSLVQTLSSYHVGLNIDKVGAPRVLLIAFLFGVATLLALHVNLIWLAFILLGLFTVFSLNAMRSFIAKYAKNQSTIFGILYGGTAFSGGLGALTTGYLWEHFSAATALNFSLVGCTFISLVTLLYWLKKSESAVFN